MKIEVDPKLVERFNKLKPVDGNDNEISLEKYLNDMLADRMEGLESDVRWGKGKTNFSN